MTYSNNGLDWSYIKNIKKQKIRPMKTFLNTNLNLLISSCVYGLLFIIYSNLILIETLLVYIANQRIIYKKHF